MFYTLSFTFPLAFLIAVCQYIDMFCIKCGHKKISVTNSRKSSSKLQIWRRRQCQNCGFIFTTYESLATDQLIVTPEGKQPLPFDDTTLLFDVGRCLEHIEAIKKAPHAKWLTDTIIHKIISTGDGTITTHTIVELTYSTLKQYDRLASIQYAARHSDKIKVRLT